VCETEYYSHEPVDGNPGWSAIGMARSQVRGGRPPEPAASFSFCELLSP
jgi:hypothetical protein